MDYKDKIIVYISGGNHDNNFYPFDLTFFIKEYTTPYDIYNHLIHNDYTKFSLRFIERIYNNSNKTLGEYIENGIQYNKKYEGLKNIKFNEGMPKILYNQEIREKLEKKII